MANEFDPERYHVSVQKQEEDGAVLYEARVAELPDVAVYAETSAGAYSEALSVIAGLYEMAQEDKQAFPVPQENTTEYSGRVTLRLPRGLHARTAACADFDGVSLNTWITTAIAEVVGERHGTVRGREVAEAAPYTASTTAISIGAQTLVQDEAVTTGGMRLFAPTGLSRRPSRRRPHSGAHQ